MIVTLSLTVNGAPRTVTTHPKRPLLDVLREDLGLTGTKFGCGRAQCGACTVLVDDRPMRSCTLPVAQVEGRAITTIEGLATPDELHPVQEAFLEEGAMQCGYCTPGMIMNAVALLRAEPAPTDETIVRRMNGHLCRCNGYPKILRAIHRAARS